MLPTITLQTLSTRRVEAEHLPLHCSLIPYTGNPVGSGSTAVANGHSGYLASDRSHAVYSWLEGTDTEFLVQIDEDVLPPVNVLDVARRDLDFVTLPALFMGDRGLKVNAAPIPGQEADLWPGDGVVEILWGGTGAICYKRSAMEKMISAFGAPFLFDVDERGLKKSGVDIAFCRRARGLGFKIWLDRDLICAHRFTIAWAPTKDGDVVGIPGGTFWLGDDVPRAGRTDRPIGELVAEWQSKHHDRAPKAEATDA